MNRTHKDCVDRTHTHMFKNIYVYEILPYCCRKLSHYAESAEQQHTHIWHEYQHSKYTFYVSRRASAKIMRPHHRRRP